MFAALNIAGNNKCMETDNIKIFFEVSSFVGNPVLSRTN